MVKKRGAIKAASAFCFSAGRSEHGVRSGAALSQLTGIQCLAQGHFSTGDASQSGPSPAVLWSKAEGTAAACRSPKKLRQLSELNIEKFAKQVTALVCICDIIKYERSEITLNV